MRHGEDMVEIEARGKRECDQAEVEDDDAELGENALSHCEVAQRVVEGGPPSERQGQCAESERERQVTDCVWTGCVTKRRAATRAIKGIASRRLRLLPSRSPRVT